MAIKINNTVVIDDGRGISGTGLTVTSISASGSVGSAASVLRSTGSGIYWSNVGVGIGSTTVFTSSGTWTKPSIGTYAFIELWGGGGGGARGADSGGGGGGAYRWALVALSSLAATEPVTIGAAGIGRTGSNGAGTAGGNTTFDVFTAGGGGAGAGPTPGLGGGGGGWVGEGSGSSGGPGYYEFGGGSPSLSGPTTLWVGASGGPNSNNGASSIYGGAGGGGRSNSTVRPGGTSTFGGNGGAGGGDSVGGVGGDRGGGGGGSNSSGGNGGRGEARIFVW